MGNFSPVSPDLRVYEDILQTIGWTPLSAATPGHPGVYPARCTLRWSFSTLRTR